MKRIWIVIMVVAVTDAAARELSWKIEAGSIALKNGKNVVWKFNAHEGEMKPVFHPIARLDGTVLSDFRPADHMWHRAGWFSFRFIDGVNYWEEDAKTGLSKGRTKVRDVKFTPHDDFSATIELSLSYYPAGQKARMHEKRLIKVSAPNKDGDYAIDWQMQFIAVDSVTLQPDAGYAGLSLRLQPALRNWKFINSEGREGSAVHGDPCQWLTFGGKLNKKVSSLTIFDHPYNLTFPTPSFVVQHMPYMSPAFLFKKEIKITKFRPLELMYRIKVNNSAPQLKEINKEFDSFSKLPFEIKHVQRINLVEVGHRIYTTHCEACHSNEEKAAGFKTGPAWWGLIGNRPNKRKAMAEGNIKDVLVNDDYIRRAITSPNIELALHSKGAQKGKPYQPIMPSYAEVLTKQEIDGVIAYMKTLNKGASRGPDEVFEADRTVVRPTSDDPNIVEVGNVPRVQRVIVKGFSPRSFAVGLPSGYSYMFDPDRCEIKYAWKGGFLNLRGERTDRGTLPNHLYKARDIGFSPFLVPVGKVKYLGYRISSDQVDIDYSINGEKLTQRVNFSNQSLDIILSRPKSGKQLRFSLDKKKLLKTESDQAQVTSGHVVIPADIARVTLKVKLSDGIKGKPGYKRLEFASAFSLGQNDGESTGAFGAIDGDLGTYWDEKDNLGNYSLRVRLKKRERFSAIRIQGYKQHDFAPKDFSVFVDGKLVKTVKNARYKNNGLELSFPAQTGWNVELRITGSYGGSPAIRELGIFQRIKK